MQRNAFYQQRLNRTFLFSLAISLCLHLAAVFYLNRHLGFLPGIGKIKHTAVKNFSFKKPGGGQVLAMVFDLKEISKANAAKKDPKPQPLKEALFEAKHATSDSMEKIARTDLVLEQKTEEIPNLAADHFLIQEEMVPKVHWQLKNSIKTTDKALLKEMQEKFLCSEPLKKKNMKFAEDELLASNGPLLKGKKKPELKFDQELEVKKEQSSEEIAPEKDKSSFFVKPVLLSSYSEALQEPSGMLLIDERTEKNHLLSILKKMQMEGSFISLEEGHLKQLLTAPAFVPTLRDLKTTSFGYNFDMELESIPKEGGGVVFALTLIPKKTIELENFKQNFYFVIDRSNSVQNKRFSATRYAVASALNTLSKNDRFNVFIFDAAFDYLFNQPQKPEKEAKAQAKKFLIGQKLGSFFSAPSYAPPFNAIVAKENREREIDNIIFITNGEGLKRSQNQEMLRDFTKYNQGKRPLYILALESDENLSQLELYATVNGGKLLTAHSPIGLKKQLKSLLHSLTEPQVECLSLKAFSLEKDNRISFFSAQSKGGYLYQNQPFVILGTAEKNGCFDLFLQGKNGGTWVNLRKEVDLTSAKEGGMALQRLWDIRKAAFFYERYLDDKDSKKLKLVQKLLNKKP